jgi:hypothetical protein
MNQDTEVVYRAECPICCYAYTCDDELRSEIKVDEHIDREHVLDRIGWLLGEKVPAVKVYEL